jgi:4-amino-4-deoxy-L-arabinose transferase-like glycosyltransferase
MTAEAPQGASRMPDGPLGWRDVRVLGVLLAVFWLTRVVWIVALPDSTTYWEEDHRWAAAVEILDDPVQPLFDYQADNYQGGSMVLIGLLTALFAVFGESVIALKAAALLFASATLVALYGLGRIWFGARVALFAGAVYVAGPPLLAYSSLLVMGSHGESALFTLAQLIVLLGLLDGRFRTPTGWAAFGVISGLGVWFCYTTGIGLLACGLTWLLLERWPRPQELGAAAAGFLVGLGPWFVYNVQNDFVGFLRLVELFGGGDPIDAWEEVGPGVKLVALVLRDAPLGLVAPFPEAAAPPIAAALALALALPAAAALALSFARVLAGFRAAGLRGRVPGEPVGGTHRAEVVFWVYTVVFVLAFVGSRFVVQPEKGAHTYRLLLPWVTVLVVPVAISAVRALARPGRARTLAVIAVVSALVASVTGTALLALRPVESRLGRDVVEHRMRGYLVRGVLLHRKYEDALQRAFQEARRVPDLRLRFRVFQGVGWGMQYRFEGTGELRPALRVVDGLVPGEKAAVLSGLRWTAGERIDALEARVASGEATPRDLAQLERLEGLWRWLEVRWNRVPPAMRYNDSIQY